MITSELAFVSGFIVVTRSKVLIGMAGWLLYLVALTKVGDYSETAMKVKG